MYQFILYQWQYILHFQIIITAIIVTFYNYFISTEVILSWIKGRNDKWFAFGCFHYELSQWSIMNINETTCFHWLDKKKWFYLSKWDKLIYYFLMFWFGRLIITVTFTCQLIAPIPETLKGKKSQMNGKNKAVDIWPIGVLSVFKKNVHNHSRKKCLWSS